MIDDEEDPLMVPNSLAIDVLKSTLEERTVELDQARECLENLRKIMKSHQEEGMSLILGSEDLTQEIKKINDALKDYDSP